MQISKLTILQQNSLTQDAIKSSIDHVTFIKITSEIYHLGLTDQVLIHEFIHRSLPCCENNPHFSLALP